MTRRSRTRGRPALAIATTLLSLVAAATWGVSTAPPATAATALRGTFTLTPGSCAGGSVSGTYLRMILPSGGVAGPYMSNADSRCADQSYTPLSAGTDGGLVSGSYQPTPQPPFDKNGNALAGRITAPSPFYGTSFATSSNSKDPQTGRSVTAPQVFASGSALSADLRAFSVTWNSQYFNQGSPKPDGSYPGNTKPAHGTFDAATGAFTLDWTSQVVGGPFDKFTGQWHLAGRFLASGGHPSGAGAGSGQSVAPGAAGTVPAAGGSRTTAPAGTRPAGGSTKLGASGTRTPAGSGAATGAVPAQAQQLAAATTTVTRDRWHVSWWLIALTIVIAVAGFAVIAWLNRSLRGTAPR